MPNFLNLVIPILLLGLFFVPLLGKGARHQEFFTAGRKAGALGVGFSLFATCIGGSAIYITYGQGFTVGWHGFWYLGAGVIGLLLLGFFWVKPLRRQKQWRTLPEWFGQTYGQPARIFSALLIAIMWIGVVMAQFAVAAQLIQSTFGWNYHWAFSVMTLAVVGYTLLGGQQAILKTDIIQTFIILLGLALPLAIFFRLDLPISSGFPTFEQPLFQSVSFTNWFTALITVGGMYIVGPDLCSRVFIAKDEASARRGVWLAATAILVVAVMMTFTAVAVKNQQLGPAPGSGQPLITWLINDAGVFNRFWSILLTSGLICALISSADTCLMTAASVCALDLNLKQKNETRRGKGFLILLGGATIALSFIDGTVYKYLLLAYSFFASGLLLPLLLIKWPTVVNKIPKVMVWLAMCSGGLTALGLQFSHFTLTSSQRGMIGFLICGLILTVGYFCPKSSKTNPET